MTDNPQKEGDKAMGRTRNIGKIVPVQKVWLSKKELAAYLGVTTRYIEMNINTNPRVDVYRMSERVVLYNKENIDLIIRRSKT